ncbi:ABC transporter ATP-binding protein [Paenarthrobacter ureafaciens]|uniref:ABC transporter ATP-binding protein n=1 Tax=Paenarthrobacter ureafaciens TaxID=37931 RepID=UPI001FB4BF81|nr:ABC transporter ATP-binding protein [Paenarthrobacter ureafaciens]UOD83012.1 ABC transporter ATP-binding protein [Paenarthrobacter ureafaciens]WNZ02719.1 ABC transporter ATP-binding protein [Paenarthrobacter ureafaciens]
MSDLVITNLTKKFGHLTVLDNVSVTASDGQILTLLGPSGCGKSTTLWSVAGLLKPDGGSIVAGDRTLFDHGTSAFLPPERRDCGVVFQSYAVWPHMKVRDNVGYPLKLRRYKSDALRRRVDEVLELVDLADQADRYPHQLSGGQQQRVALARALAFPPRLLLLDEPFSNLDAKLRERTRDWLLQLQRRIGVTTVFVTHDQDEALAMSDKIAVMSAGMVRQIGTPEQIYNDPADIFVADFVGTSNLLEGTVISRSKGVLTIKIDGLDQAIHVPSSLDSDGVVIAVRPEALALLPDDAPSEGYEMTVNGPVLERSYHGHHFRYRVGVGEQSLVVETRDRTDSSHVRVGIPRDGYKLFQPRTAPATKGAL